MLTILATLAMAQCPVGGICPIQRPGIVIPKPMIGPAVTVVRTAPVATSNRTVVRHRSGVRIARPRIIGWR